MNRIRGMGALLCACAMLVGGAAIAQEAGVSAQVKLLDQLAGSWLMKGTIDGKAVTHDVSAEWILSREYLQIHELSREKNDKGGPFYEAMILIEWDTKRKQYACLWLDTTSGGGLSGEGLGRAMEAGDSIPIVITIGGREAIHTTFAYERAADAWHWTIDDVSKGKPERFADLRLTRKR